MKRREQEPAEVALNLAVTLPLWLAIPILRVYVALLILDWHGFGPEPTWPMVAAGVFAVAALRRPMPPHPDGDNPYMPLVRCVAEVTGLGILAGVAALVA